MPRRAYTALAAAILAGCMAPAPRAPANWTIDCPADPSRRAAAPGYAAVRLARLDVMAPYDGTKLAVLRSDGTVAFDPGNSFAAAPAALLRGAAADVAEACGFASSVVDSRSSASVPLSLEITVSRFALDCRDGGRKASVALAASLLDGRGVKASARASASADAAEGNYSAAFSQAFSQALADALGRL